MTKRTVPILVASLALSLSARAYAHGPDGQHLMGVVHHITKNTLALETEDKRHIEVTLTASTKLERDGKPAKVEQLVAGQRVVVHARKTSRGALEATLVKLGPPPQSPSSPSAPIKNVSDRHHHREGR